MVPAAPIIAMVCFIALPRSFVKNRVQMFVLQIYIGKLPYAFTWGKKYRYPMVSGWLLVRPQFMSPEESTSESQDSCRSEVGTESGSDVVVPEMQILE